MPDPAAGHAVTESGGPARFKRVLSRGDLILYGLVILTPTAPYPVYGIVQQVSGGHAALAYVAALVAMLFTAASYGKMSGAFPSAGSTYTYAQRALNEHVGFLAGWAMMLDYFLIPLLSVIYAALTAARLLPQVPYIVWAVFFTVTITLINVRGIRVTTRASTFMMLIMSSSLAWRYSPYLAGFVASRAPVHCFALLGGTLLARTWAWSSKATTVRARRFSFGRSPTTLAMAGAL